jgi:hypothetical protein
VSGLAQFFERAGLATVVLALYREHAAKIAPPRVLAVPFQLGRALGVPNDPAFQRRVLMAAFELLEAERGPVFADYPEAEPNIEPTGWMPPIPLAKPYDGRSGNEGFGPALTAEIAAIKPYYDQAVRQRGRTTVGASGYPVLVARDFLLAFLNGRPTPKPGRGLNTAMALKLACEDLTAYTMEAATNTAERPVPTADLVPWFWCDTTLGHAILSLYEVCEKSAEPTIKELTQLLLLPSFWDFRKKPEVHRPPPR